MQVAQAIDTAPSVVAGLSYLTPTSERPYTYMYEPPEGMARENCEYEFRSVEIADARQAPVPASLEWQGFELWGAPSSIKDFRDEAAVRSVYYAEMAELALAVTGATRAFVFDHQVRRREADRRALTFGRNGDGTQPAAVGRIHNDYTEESGRRRLSMVSGEDPSSVKRFSIVNIWRPIKGPVLDTPLAVCDARTVSAADLISSEVRYPTRSGEICLVVHSPRHRWHYYSGMERGEALVFKQYDSQREGVSRFTPHAAFDHPEAPADAPLRESIEGRCLVVYD